MEIKTIVTVDLVEFDREVNKALTEGWHLAKRERVDTEHSKGVYFLYAELVKVEKTAEPVTWQEAAQVLKSTCSENDTCDTCKLREWCDEYLARGAEPEEWEVPTE